MSYPPYYESILMETPYTIYIVSGSGQWIYHAVTDSVIHQDTPMSWVNRNIRGNAPNDLYLAGYGGEIGHYNGLHWYKYNEIPEMISEPGDIIFSGMDVKDGMTVVVGAAVTYQTKDLIVIGKR